MSTKILIKLNKPVQRYMYKNELFEANVIYRVDEAKGAVLLSKTDEHGRNYFSEVANPNTPKKEVVQVAPRRRGRPPGSGKKAVETMEIRESGDRTSADEEDTKLRGPAEVEEGPAEIVDTGETDSGVESDDVDEEDGIEV